MRFLLDTDTCIYAIGRRAPAVVTRFDRLKAGEAAISIVTHGELLFGARKSRKPDVALAHVEALTSVVQIEALPLAAAEHYADIRHALESRGQPIGGNDLWIAAHARCADLVLVTNNQREFRRVAGLRLQNWS